MAKGQKHDEVCHQKSRLGAVLSDNLPIWDGNEEYWPIISIRNDAILGFDLYYKTLKSRGHNIYWQPQKRIARLLLFDK